MLRGGKDLIAWRAGRAISRREFLGAVHACAAQLPAGSRVCNVCEDPYLFMVAFCAVVLRGQCNCLPANHRPGTLSDCAVEQGCHLLLHDGSLPVDTSPFQSAVNVADCCRQDLSVDEVPQIPADQLAAMLFTSGSTGQSVAITKTWGALAEGAAINGQLLAEIAGDLSTCLGTVPVWHMYGLEWTILVPLFSEIAVYSGVAFYPADLRDALSDIPAPCYLVTTPLHLQAMLRSGLKFPRTELLMCATAPLQMALAAKAEQDMGGGMLEIYGCTEAGSMAYRLPARDLSWSFLPAFSYSREDEVVTISAPHLNEAVELADTLQFGPDDKFTIEGRRDDIIKVGGKRISLQQLTNLLLNLQGVSDAAIFALPETYDSRGPSLAALVVCQDRTVADLQHELRSCIDPVFVPRQLRLVPELPREPNGKLPRARLLELLATEPPA